MSDGDAILRAICEDPEDLTPRWVYADWLEDDGRGARAQFIRAQLRGDGVEARRLLREGLYGWVLGELADLMRLPDDAVKATQRSRGMHLGEGGRILWNNTTVPFMEFRNGFVEAIRRTTKGWASSGAWSVSRQPLRELTLADAVEDTAFGPVVLLSDMPRSLREAVDREFATAGRPSFIGQFGDGVQFSPRCPFGEAEARVGAAALRWARGEWATWGDMLPVSHVGQLSKPQGGAQ